MYVSQTYTQYVISTHLDLQYIWLKAIRSIWSVLTSICSICDSKLNAVHDQFSHRSAVYVTQNYTQYMICSHIDLQYVTQNCTQYMISSHIDLQYMWFKTLRSTWSVLTSICSIRRTPTQTYTQYMISSHVELHYTWLKPINLIWSVLTSICSICDSNLYAVHDQYSHRSAVNATQIDTQYMIYTHIDLLYMGLKTMCSIWSVLTSICCVCDLNQ